jgi:hypothetical protein
MWFDVDHQVLVLASTSMNWFGGDLYYHAWAGTHWEAFGAGYLNQGHSLSSAVYWPEFRSPVVITSTTQLSSWLDVQLDDDSLDRRARPSPCVGGADVPRRLSSWSWNDVARNARRNGGAPSRVWLVGCERVRAVHDGQSRPHSAGQQDQVGRGEIRSRGEIAEGETM